MTSEDDRAEHRLEAAIRAGLDRCDGRLDEITAWVMTGLPSDIDLGGAFGKTPTLGAPDLRAVIVAALGDSDPMVEWRLGYLAANNPRSQMAGPEPLFGIWLLRVGQWPHDARMMEILAAAAVSGEEYLELLLGQHQSISGNRCEELRSRPSFGRLVGDHPAIVRPHLEGDANQMAAVTRCLLDAPPDSLTGYSDTIAWLMANTSKKRRLAGASLGRHVGYTAIAPHLQKLATEGEATVRVKAIRALSRLGGDKHRTEVILFCETSLKDDRSSSVQKVIADILQLAGSQSELPEVQLPDLSDVLADDEVRAAYEAALQQVYEADKSRYEHAQAAIKGGSAAAQSSWASLAEPPVEWPQGLVESGWTYLCDGGPLPDFTQQYRGSTNLALVIGQLHPLHGFRLMRLMGFDFRRGGVLSASLDKYSETGKPTPLELQAAAEAAGFDRQLVLEGIPDDLPWSREDTSPWVVALLPSFVEVIEADVVDRWNKADKYYEAVGTLPTIPAALRQLLMVQAISGRKTTRQLAKAALAHDEDLITSVVEYLRSKKYEERAEAASWLVELGATEVVDSLHKAAAKEKHDYAKSAILNALERFGEPIDQYLDRESLLDDSVKGLAKKLPAAAEWIPFDSLPSLRWDDGSQVDPSIVKWLVIQAVRLKSPAPSPMVRRFFGQMVAADVEEFANSVLSMWLVEDVRPLSLEDATARAKQDAQEAQSHASQQWLISSMSEAEYLDRFVQQHTTAPSGSAVASKGLLSLAAAGGGFDAIAPAEAFLRKWYGWRPSQCRSLVEMLAWLEDPNAVQLVLSVGNRFRTKGIQKEAHLQAQLLAERSGWTLEDLGDRTVATGGFAADGSQVFDYGDRQFTARLTDDLVVVLSDADGKQVKALPAPRQGEDEDLAKAAKKDFALAKKVAKLVATERPLRLHEAMCLQRRFEPDDFHRYILGHPLTSRLAIRLVWAAIDPTGERILFRPLSDGTLIDEHDEEVSVVASSAVVLAHGLIDGEDAGSAWLQHLADYQVASLFPQFRRSQLPELSPRQKTLNGCEGAVFDDRRIRSVAKKAGFELGPGEDGGRVSAITRRFPAAGIEARVTVVGLHAAVLGQEVALEELQFGPLDSYQMTPLVDVPEVLLVETIADVDQIVASSERIDKDWLKKFF